MFRKIYRGIRKLNILLHSFCSRFITLVRLQGNGVVYGKNLRCFGSPVIDIWTSGKCIIGDNVTLNNGALYNIIGRQQPCMLVVRNGAILKIGSDTGMSAVAIVCSTSVTIGKFVKIGGNTVIYDTDFHSIDAANRADVALDHAHTNHLPVIIGDHAFIGAHSTILKGVCIGEKAIIGAGSVVTKNIPAGEIWAGNPAKFIKKIPA